MQSRDESHVVQRKGAVRARVDSVVREANLPRLAVVALQLALLLGVAHVFQLESLAFRKVMALALVGFVIHHALPMALRLPFFVVLSFASLALVVLPLNALRLVAVGSILIALCHLPIRFAWRVALTGAAAATLVVVRGGWLIDLRDYGVVWPILGSMFMFRLIIYLYDLRNRTAPFGFWRALAYFFMLPNVCFPMYPIADYQTFNRTYFNEPSPWRMYQLGIKWMFRGLIHLLLYRLVSYDLIISADSVADAGDLVRYMVTTFLLYLQISGQFHLAIGLLHLFGFNLPETHHNYLLSSSFTDFWRRINIYWKDFVLKLFFNPAYFRVKHWGVAPAMVLATLVAFFFTWLLHSYQWFWIRGSYPIIWQDITFWTVLALLVLVNALAEQRHGRQRALRDQKRSIGARVGLGLRTIGTFCVIVTLWCLWTFEGTVADWLRFMANIFRMDVRTAVWVALGLGGLGLASVLLADVGREYSAGQKTDRKGTAADRPFAFSRSAALAMTASTALLLVGQYNYLLPLGKAAGKALVDLKQAELGPRDRDEEDQGYYEKLVNPRNYNLALWELYSGQSADLARLGDTEVVRDLPDQFHLKELAPSKQIVFRGEPMSTNRWGMRDRDYEQHKKAGVYRIAMIGTSVTMGWCVKDDQTYENLLEARLNQDQRVGTQGRVEVLNFGVGGYSSWQRLWALERALEFEPDAIIWECHSSEFRVQTNHLLDVIRSQVPIPYPELRKWVEASGFAAQPGSPQVRAALRQKAPEILTWAWRRARRQCAERGISFQIMLVPRLDSSDQHKAGLGGLIRLARRIGVPVIDLRGAYGEEAQYAELRVAPWDFHPNAEGHRRLAEALYQWMAEHEEWSAALGVGGSTRGQTID